MSHPTHCRACGRQFAIARWDTTRPHRSGMNPNVCRDCYNSPENPMTPSQTPGIESGPSGTLPGASLTTEAK